MLSHLIAVCVLDLTAAVPADDLASLGHDLWAWRAVTHPVNRDDVQRVVEPPGWAPNWSQPAVEERRRVLAELRTRWLALSDAKAPVAAQVDHALLGTAL